MPLTKIDDSGPAFPCADDATTSNAGMTLRKWFAGQALAGLLAAQKWDAYENAVRRSYEIADAMIAAGEAAQ